MKRFKYFFRKFRYNRKRSTLVGVLVLLCLSLTLGFAYLTTELNINGVVNIASSRWDIHFENIEIGEDSVEATTEPTISNNTTITFAATLSNPGDFYEFTTDIVNDGTYDAKIDSITLSPTLTSEEEEYFEYKIEYTEGGNIQVDDALDAGTSENIKVLLKYKTNQDSSKYSEEDTDFTVQVTITYVQGKGNEVHHTTLYSVLKDAASDGTYAREYTGEHHDSFTKAPSKKIYHWYGSNDANGTAIQNKFNVIFANHCWWMIRTTDTGGVKMIYNGEADDGKCLNTRGTHVGYSQRTSQSLNSNYWYGTDYTYDKTNNVFSISGTTEQTIWSEANASGLIGKYTCKQATETGTCTTLYLVESYYNTTSAYVIPLNSNSNYSQFGTLQFNASSNSPSYVGYMYNTVYPYQSKSPSTETMLLSSSLGTNYWYANSVTWGSPTANRYNLDNPYQVTSTDDYPSLIGKYTFRNTSQTYTNTSVYYIASVSGSTMYYINLIDTGNHTLTDFNYTYTYGDSFTDNGNGTYTINNVTTIERKNWYTGYSNVGAGKYVCKNATNNTCGELWYTISTSNTSMSYIKDFTNVKYAKSFIWDGNKYVLDNDTSVSFWNINDSANQASINNAHYTCWNTTGECESISYIYYINGATQYYISITNGKSVEDTINEMLYDNGVNQVNSTMKSGVDAWYKHYLLEDYDDYIEDTIFCNERSIRALNGWNPDGGMTNSYLQFKEYNFTSDLSCTNTTDQFSLSNNNAKLTYKVGLMSSPEMYILNKSNARKTGQYYPLASPYFFNVNGALGYRVNTSGDMYNPGLVSSTSGVRPAISLKPGTEYTSGDGSMANPYVIE